MKLLQVCNVAQIVGGTGACAWTITRALPEWQHEVFFFGRLPIPEEVQDAFSGDGRAVRQGTAVTREMMEDCDAAIFHNTPEYRMPSNFPEGMLRVYYQHSVSDLCRGARQRCDLTLACSKYLADLAGLDDSSVLLQPVPRPPYSLSVDTADDWNGLRIGRLCTPNRDKWKPEDVLPLYERLASEFPSIRWEFVGCPHNLRESLTAACGGRAVHFDAGWKMRAMIHQWDALLYHSSLVETYGRVVCEAQQSGCIPIVDDAGGFREQVVHHETGFLCASVDDFVESVRKIHDKRQLRINLEGNAIGAGGRRGLLLKWRNSFLQRCSATVAGS